MIETINERIRVGAVFTGDQINPVWFTWKNRKYKIEQVTYTWRDREGEAILHYFNVLHSANLYELCLNNKTLVWHLLKVTQA
ncbi:MAG: hypothetical protein PHV60_08840 [bacterium]|nr:hypothetical protein [bacterium]